MVGHNQKNVENFINITLKITKQLLCCDRFAFILLVIINSKRFLLVEAVYKKYQPGNLPLKRATLLTEQIYCRYSNCLLQVTKSNFLSGHSNMSDMLKCFSVEHHSSIDDEISQFNQILKSVAEISLVPSHRKTRKKTKKSKPWYDNTCRQLKKELQKLANKILIPQLLDHCDKNILFSKRNTKVGKKDP